MGQEFGPFSREDPIFFLRSLHTSYLFCDSVYVAVLFFHFLTLGLLCEASHGL